MAMPLRVLIVDDEVLARKRMRRFLALETEVEVLRECAGGSEAIRAIGELHPDLVFLDIQMPQISGFDVIAAVGASRMPPVVFVTAYDEFALQAFDADALGYLLKPFDQHRFHEVLQRARRYCSANADFTERLQHLLQRVTDTRYPARLAVRTEGKILFVPVAEVDWIEACGNYVNVHSGGRAYLLRRPLHHLEQRLDPACFLRAHRSVIVNVNRIREIQPYFQGNHVIILSNGDKLFASRAGMQRLQQILGDPDEPV
jgi:two-component system LytT family response regulator